MSEKNYHVLHGENGDIIKAWIKGVSLDRSTEKQAFAVKSLPCVNDVVLMPDAHVGQGATIGSVVVTTDVVIPSAVGVDIGCGMLGAKLPLHKEEFGHLGITRARIESVVPIGRSDGDIMDTGSWQGAANEARDYEIIQTELLVGLNDLATDFPGLKKGKIGVIYHAENMLGTLGTGNHFIELLEDEEEYVWLVIHSGSRGIGNRIARYFQKAAKEECARWYVPLPSQDLAYLAKGTEYYDGYLRAVNWAQRYAKSNRKVMMENILNALFVDDPLEVIDCHHNYIAMENHKTPQGQRNVWVTRKGAVRAREGDLGIIPGDMGAEALTYIVEGKGNPESYHSCSHGAGRVMTRTEAKKKCSIYQLKLATEGVECYNGIEVLDEIPAAYKHIDDVMKAQEDLVTVKHKLKKFLNVKGH